MSKLRSDSTWAGLTPEQRETLEGWLFEENLGYKEALGRAQKEFGITASLTSLADYYQRAARERAQEELLEVKETADDIINAKVDWDDLGATAMMLTAKRMIQLAVESPGRVREMVSLGRLLVAHNNHDVRRRRIEMEERLDGERRLERLQEAKDEAEYLAELYRRFPDFAPKTKPEGEMPLAGGAG